MLRKYNIAINIAFWLLVTAIIAVFSITLFFPESKLKLFLFGEHNEVVEEGQPESGPVIITGVKEIKKDVEWFHFVATAYSKDDPGQGTSETTATGKAVHEGIIAVDPEVIPYGTAVEIKDMGFFIAEDCGGKIKGNRIDIYFDSVEEAENFGRQDIWIRFVGNNPLEIAVSK